MGRRDRISHIEREIGRFQERATELLRREITARNRVDELERQADYTASGPRMRWQDRKLRRARGLAWRRADEREAFVEQGLRAIMLTLEEQAQRTREQLDRELERLVPIQAEWERLRGVFELVEAAVAIPAVEEQACQWRGHLDIPDFPVREHEGYLKPFPENALLF